MTLYAGAILLTELMMLAMTFHILDYSGFSRAQKQWYLLTFCAIMFCAGAEFAAIHFNSRGPAFVLPLTVITVLQFSLTPLLPVFFSGALGMRKEATYVGAFFSLNALAEILSAPFGWIFYFDQNGTYVRGAGYLVYEAFYLLSLVFLIISLILVGKRFRQRDRWTITMVLIIMVAAILPLILYKIYTDYIGIGLCACLCYIYYNDLIQEDIKAELIEKQKRISDMQEHIISGLASLIEDRDVETGEHVARTRDYVRALAELAREDGVYADQLTDRFIRLLYELAPMHDIGKIVVSDQILKKPGRLTAEEFETMKKHASAGGAVMMDILSGITDEESLSFAGDIAVYHHERWDGSGYPDGLKGEEIPLAARIMAIADVFDALVSERCYKDAIPVEEAFEVIRTESGSHFDPKLVEVFLAHKEVFRKIQKAEV